MAFIDSPADPRVQAMVDRTYAALRVSGRALEWKSQDGQVPGGHYRTAFATGLTTIIAAGGAIVSLQWKNQSKLFALLRLRAWATITTAFTTAQEVSLDMIKLTGFTAPDTGGTDIGALLRQGAGKKHNQMAPSAVDDLRVATTVALGAGTGAVDAMINGFGCLPVVNVVGSMAGETLADIEGSTESPLILMANEGFRVRIPIVQGAVGVVRYNFVMDHAELPIY